MNTLDIKAPLMKIEILWANILKEDSDDIDAWDYIAAQSILMKMTAFQLKDRIENRMLKNKEVKIRLLKLHKALTSIVGNLDFEIRVEKDKEYIEDILDRLSGLKKDIDVVKQYQ